MKRSTAELVLNARRAGTAVPSFNIPYLPMMEAVVRALRDTNCVGLIAAARCDWEKFQALSPRAVRDEYQRLKDERLTRLHMDHVPVVDEDGRRVDAEAILAEALDLGYESVMVDGSRLPLEENIAVTARVVERARAAGAAAEAELGAIMGHEEGPMPPYDELFASGRGFTDPAEAGRFVRDTAVDWLSVAIGNFHGAISKARKDARKPQARLNIDHLRKIARLADVPLVLHGGTGIPRHYLSQAFRTGIARVNIAAAIRQAYESAMEQSVAKAQQLTYGTAVRTIRDDLGIEGSAAIIDPAG